MQQRSVGFTPKFLALVFVLFIGILVWAYIKTKEANPVILDGQGHVREGGTAPSR